MKERSRLFGERLTVLSHEFRMKDIQLKSDKEVGMEAPVWGRNISERRSEWIIWSGKHHTWNQHPGPQGNGTTSEQQEQMKRWEQGVFQLRTPCLHEQSLHRRSVSWCFTKNKRPCSFKAFILDKLHWIVYQPRSNNENFCMFSIWS